MKISPHGNYSGLPLLGNTEEAAVTANHSIYGYKGSENYEHDDTGCIHNYSGVEDDVFSAFADNEGWSEGYDY